MNIVAKLTLAQVKVSRRRFLVTVLGVMLSAALVTAVLLGADSCMEMLRRVEIGYGGEWHWQGWNLPAEAWAQLAADPHFDQVGAESLEGFAALLEPGSTLWMTETEDGTQLDRRTAAAGQNVTVTRVSDTLWPMMQSQLAEGRWPEAENEAVIPKNLALARGYAVGDTVAVLYEESGLVCRYQITGILEYSVLTGDTGVPAGGTFQLFLPLTGETAAAPQPGGEERWLVVYATAARLDEDFADWCFAELDPACSANWPGSYSWLNSNLLEYSGVGAGTGFSRLVNGLRTLMLAIIAAASVLLIVNSFSISLAERRRTLGMLASVGATRAQKTAFVLYEAALVGALGIPLGLGAGCLGLAVTFRLIDPLVQRLPLLGKALPGGGQLLRLVVRPQWLLLAAAATAAILFCSAWFPARRAAKASAIDAIRGAGEVRVSASRRQLRAGRLFGALFGPEGALAQKNAKRSYRRYLATLVSLILSVVLLLSASGLALYLEKGYTMSHDASVYQVRATVNTDIYTSPEQAAPVLQRLAQPTTPVAAVQQAETIQWGSLAFPREKLTGQQAGLMEQQGDSGLDDNTRALVTDTTVAMAPHILVLPDEEFALWAGYSLNPRGDTLECVLVNSYVYAGGGSYAELAPTTLAAGDTLEWEFNTMPITLYLAGVADGRAGAGYVQTWNDTHQLQFVTSQSAADAVFAAYYAQRGEYCPRQYTLYYQTDDALGLEAELNGLEFEGYNGYVLVVNEEQQAAQMTTMLTLMRVVLYGFIALVGLVCAANIWNTVSTGLALRRRELAMLQSVGMPPEGLRKMVLLESVVYAFWALAWGLPLSLVVLWKEYSLLRRALIFRFTLPWGAVAAAVIGVLALTAAVALPSVKALGRTSIVENLRQDADS